MHSFSCRRRFAAAASISAFVLACVVPLAAVSQAALAQDDSGDDGTPPVAASVPGGVARIDALSGDVAVQRGDSNDTLAAVVNAPVLAADYITTGSDGRAEVGFDGRSAVRLGANVQMRFAKVDPGDRQLQLAAGSIDLRLFGDTDGQSSIDTPSISIVPRTAGSFRVSVDAQGDTYVTVRAGRADVVTPEGSQSLEPGTTVAADGPAANPQVQAQPALAMDAFDGYNAERDHVYQAALADAQYTNPNIEGVGDLNAYGHWVDDSSYGNVWIPASVGPGWAPYRNGNWTWEDGYGWTWVAAEPWGWAPYHYGRWYFSAAYQQWAWYPPPPGRIVPAWSPALVGFVGFNIGAVGVGIGFGNIGWVPLAPYEPFHPWWGPHATAFASTTININYRNVTVVNAMTSVTRENFQAGRFGNPVAVSQAQIQAFHPMPMQGPLPIVPSQANLRFTQHAPPPQLAVHAAFAGSGFAGHVNAVTRTPFSQQQASVSHVTHVAYHPAGPAPAPGGAAAGFGHAPNGGGAPPSFSRPGSAAGSPAAYSRPASGGASPSFARPATADSWSRFDANRPAAGGAYRSDTAYPQPEYRQPAGGDARPVAPAYARPAAPAYARPAAPAYARPAAPAYARPAAPGYSRPAAPGYARSDSGYSRSDSAGYSRQAAPAYARPAPAYSRPSAPSYGQPQQQARQQSRSAQNEGRRER